MFKKNLMFFFILLGSFLAVNAQNQLSAIDVQHYTFSLRLNDANDTIKGEAIIRVRFLKDVNSFQLNLVKKNIQGKGMLVSAVTEEGNPVSFVQDIGTISIQAIATASSTHNYIVTYQGIPADGLIISVNKFGQRTFFGDNWPNRAHNWLPCADYPADKATVDFIVTAPDHYQVVANGLKISETALPNKLKITHWKETAPLPTKVMVIGVAEFAIDHTGDVGNVPLYTYVFPENKDAGFKSYAVAKDILAYYVRKFGPYAYEKLANVQSKTIFGGMENAGAIFYFENSVGDKGIEELMAHEIAHQWFGDAASEKNFSNLWLSEGFATYMTNVYLESKYGEDTLRKRLVADRTTILAFKREKSVPVVDTTSNYMQLLNASSYQKGGWVLHMLRRKLGDQVFFKGIRNYYAKYDGGNANTDDLKEVMEKAAGKDLTYFFKQWLYTPGHPELAITWKYDPLKKFITVNIKQTQEVLFDFPLDVVIDHQLHKINIRNKNTIIRFALKGKPSDISFDPSVNLLASFEVRKGN